MTTHIETLSGEPLSWPELLRRAADWHAAHDPAPITINWPAFHAARESQQRRERVAERRQRYARGYRYTRLA